MANGNGDGRSSLQIIQTVLLVIATGMGGWVVHTVHQQELSIIEMRENIKVQSKHRWSSIHQKVWSTQLQQTNPNITVPDPFVTLRDYEP